MLTREDALNTMGATLDDWVDKKNMHMLIDKIYDEHELELKAKDEEIERLKSNETAHCVDSYFIGYARAHTKARSIVAMLFWEWKKRKRLYIANGHRSSNAGWGLYEQANLMEVMFKQAYKMLKKDNA